MSGQGNRKKRDSKAALVTLTAGLAHELRNPLNSATLQLGALLRSSAGSALSEVARSQILAARAEIQRMAELVDDYVSLTEPRLIDPAPTSLSAAARDAVSKFRSEFIELSIPESLPLVFADASLLTQVFTHLLKNSLDAVANEPAPLVEILAHDRGENVEVTVRDNGPGFPDDLSEVAFDPFTTSKAAGTGLGLTLVRQVVGAHGGTTRIESSQRGSAIRFTLPVAELEDEIC